MDSRWVSEKIFQGEISRRVPKRHPSHSFQFALSREFYCPLPFTFHPAFMPSYLPTASHGLSSACPTHATHSVTHRSLHMQAHMLFGGHCPPTPPFVPITFWSLKLSFPPPGLLRVHHGGDVHCPPAQEHPRTAACPRANVLAPPTSPQPLLPAYSAITPTSASHFPGAPSDKFIKLRDDTVNGHIQKKKKKERKKKGEGEKRLEHPLMLQGELCAPKVMRVG